MKTFICIGPNRGDLHMTMLMVNHDRFFMIEPLPDAAQWLRENHVASEETFYVIEAACGEAAGKAMLNIYNTNGVSSSLGVCTQQAREGFAHSDLTCKGQIEVEVINLSDWLVANNIDQVETLLIDAQGMDLTILRTIRPYLEERRIKRIIHECDNTGFRCYDGIPDNSLAGSIEFFEELGNYRMTPLTSSNQLQFDVEWVVKG